MQIHVEICRNNSGDEETGPAETAIQSWEKMDILSKKSRYLEVWGWGRGKSGTIEFLMLILMQSRYQTNYVMGGTVHPDGW